MNEGLALAVFTGLEGLHAYSAFLPSIMTIHSFVDNQDKLTAIREGEVFATGFVAALAITVAYLTRSYLPLVMAAVAATAALAVYEYAIQRSPVKE